MSHRALLRNVVNGVLRRGDMPLLPEVIEASGVDPMTRAQVRLPPHVALCSTNPCSCTTDTR